MRIHRQHLHDEQEKRRAHFTDTFIYLLIAVIVLHIFGCHTRVYNALSGPFHLTFDQFSNTLDKYNSIQLDEGQTTSGLFSFPREYLQIELGENEVEQEAQNIVYIYSTNSRDGKVLYTLNRVKQLNLVVNLHPNKLYIKLPTPDQNYFHNRHPYRFSSFKVETLRCIVRQIGIPPNEYMRWIEKSIYIKTIEEIYAQNFTSFNLKVIPRCGILLGYLYRPKYKSAYGFNIKSPIYFHKLDIAFDASSSYYPYKTFLFGGLLFNCLLIKSLCYMFVYLCNAIYKPPLYIHNAVKNYLDMLRINSLEKLDELLWNTRYENNYRDRLFIIRNRFLVMLNIDWHEYDTCTLRQFYVEEPFSIIPVENIIGIQVDEIVTEYDSQQFWYYLPTTSFVTDKYGATWLHEKLMNISETYQQHYEEKQLREIEECHRQQAVIENQRRLAFLIAEEEQYQRLAYQNDYEPIWNRSTPASPRFIAEFRMMNLQQVPDDLYDTSCTICLENFEYAEHYAEWPCDAKHIFHHNCMLKLLRTQNTCPLCRHSVERSDFAIRLTVSQYFSRIFI